MRHQEIYTVAFRRKREGKTDYRARLRLLKSGKPRLVVRRSLQHVYTQLTVYHPQGDRVLVSANSKELQKQYGYKLHGKNLCSAYLVGFLLGKKALDNKIQEAVLDMGLAASTKGSRIYAVVQGSLDAGLKIPSGKEILPSPERVLGKHIQQHLEHARGNQFAQYRKTGLKPEDIPKHIVEVKNKIQGGK